MIYLFGERSAGENAPRIEELRLQEALLELVQNTYMNWLLDRAQRATKFEHLGKLVAQVRVCRIFAHEDAERIGALCELIIADATKATIGQLMRRVPTEGRDSTDSGRWHTQRGNPHAV